MITDLLHAVADLINANADGGTPYSQPFTAEMAYLPAEDLASLAGIHVYVVPSSVTSEIVSRNREQSDVTIDVAVTRKLAAPDRDSQAWREELAGMIRLVEEIGTSIRFKAAGAATWKQNQIAPIYDPKRLRETGVFLSVLRVTYWTEE